MTKFIFVTGGVVSSLGKGLTSACIGTLLESRKFRVAMQKMDPYINIDPGTMSPFQHGEVYVTEDGAETDLDLGHYERFTNATITRDSNYTAGKIYHSVITKERRGEYLGQTVQVVPHVTNEIKESIRKVAVPGVDVVVTEFGGTVGDIEGLPFLEAIRQLALEVGKENVLFIHLTLVPYLRASDEIKTKPTQHSVGKLREIGIQPDILICRGEKPLPEEARAKIGLFCNLSKECVLEERDVECSIYELPLVLVREGLDELICRKLGLPAHSADLSQWEHVGEVLRNPRQWVTIAVVGKYLALQDSYKSIYEALTHGGIANECRVRIQKVSAEEIEKGQSSQLLEGAHGVLVPGGFGERGIEGKIEAIRYARTQRVPFLGICLGMQCASIEFGRSVANLKNANSSEFATGECDRVIDLMTTQRGITDKGGTMRLGAYPCVITPGSLAHQAYGRELVMERHRHRYEFNNRYRELFLRKGLRFTGLSPNSELVEVIELEDHPWFLATQFHPEFKSKPTQPHPLYRAFVRACLVGSKEQKPTRWRVKAKG